MNPMYEFEDIDDYLHDRMSASDRQAFEQALQADTDLAQRVEALRSESTVLQLLRDEHLLSQFADWEAEIGEKKTGPGSSGQTGELQVVSRNWRRWIIPAAAASVIGFAAIGFSLGWFDTNPDQPQIVVQNPGEQPNQPAIDSIAKKDATPPFPPDNPPALKEKDQNAAQYASLANKAYRPEDFKLTLMGDHAEEAETPLTKAVKLYDAGKYQATLGLLQQPDEKQKQQYLYLRAYTYYNLKRYAEAEKDFREFRNFRFSDYKMDAQWGEVFCLVKQLPSPAARKRLDAVLKEMIEQNHPYKDRAVSLKDSLKKVDGGK